MRSRAPASEAARAKRDACSRLALATIEGPQRGERDPIEAVLGPEPDATLAGLFEEGFEGRVRARGELGRVVLLGTFAVGWPHAPASSRETSLVSAGDVGATPQSCSSNSPAGSSTPSSTSSITLSMVPISGWASSMRVFQGSTAPPISRKSSKAMCSLRRPTPSR